MSDLESILSGESARAPEPAEKPIETPAAPLETQQGGQGDGDHDLPDGDGQVPVAALRAEREKGKKRYTDVVADFDKKFAESEQRWEQRLNQIVGTIGRPQAQPEAPQAPDIWEDPSRFVQHGAQQVFDPLHRRAMALARDAAEDKYDPETVKAAEAEFNRLAFSKQMEAETFHRIQNSHNPYRAAVEWHRQQTAMAEIGSDPTAYKERLREEIRESLLAEMQSGSEPSAQSSPAPVMPSNFAAGRNVGSRSGPAWSGPAPLGDIFARR